MFNLGPGELLVILVLAAGFLISKLLIGRRAQIDLVGRARWTPADWLLL